MFDLVNVETDCLKNPKVCHVIGQSIAPPFLSRVMTQGQLVAHSSTLRQRSDPLLGQAEKEGDEARAEKLRQHVFAGIGHALEQYVRVFCDTRSVEEKLERWVFGKYWKQDSRSLAEATRQSLISGEAAWQHFEGVTIEDWATAAIGFCRALEADSCPSYSSNFSIHFSKRFASEKVIRHCSISCWHFRACAWSKDHASGRL